MINEKDKKILNIIQNHAKTTNSDIAKEMKMAPSAILERVKKLEKNGILRNYTAQLDKDALGIRITAYANVKIGGSNWSDKVGEELAKIPWIQEIHEIVGEDSYLIKLVAKDPQHLSKILKTKVGVIAEVEQTKTTMVLNTIKESTKIPIE